MYLNNIFYSEKERTEKRYTMSRAAGAARELLKRWTRGSVHVICTARVPRGLDMQVPMLTTVELNQWMEVLVEDSLHAYNFPGMLPKGILDLEAKNGYASSEDLERAVHSFYALRGHLSAPLSSTRCGCNHHA